MMETTMEPREKLPLAVLAPGEAARVVDLTGEGAFRRRLLDMGFVGGAIVCVIKHAPFGNPVEYCLRGCHVTLRRQEAAHVLVERTEPPSWCRRRVRRGVRRRRARRLGWRRGRPSR
jgi:ferrous iron transport protein A